MKKVIDWADRENLINHNQKLEAIGRFMQQVPQGNFIMIEGNDLFWDLGYIISEESKKIAGIIGTYDEFSDAHKRGELE